MFANRSVDFPGFFISSGEAWLEYLICSRYAPRRLRLQGNF